MTQAHPTILQIIPRLDTGGAELSTIETADAVVRAGGRMIVVTEGGRLTAEITRLGAELIDFPAATKNPVSIIANGWRLATLVNKLGVDLLHARSRAPAWSALIAARRTGTPLVTTYHGAYNASGPLKNAYNSVMARGDLVVANSRFTARLIRQHHNVPAERLRVIHRGVDLARFDPAAIPPERLAALRMSWALEPHSRVILHAARLTGWKGQRVLIEAAAILEKQGHLRDSIIILAGDAQGRDGYTDELRTRIADAGLAHKIRIVGHCADIAAAYRLATVTVVPSVEPEAFGRSVAEALALECLVVATDLGAPPEILRWDSHAVDDSESRAAGHGPPRALPRASCVLPRALDESWGWLVAPGDAQALADAIGAALALPVEARRQAGRAARAHVVARFSSERMKQAKLEIYDELLGTGLAAAFAATGGAAPTMGDRS